MPSTTITPDHETSMTIQVKPPNYLAPKLAPPMYRWNSLLRHILLSDYGRYGMKPKEKESTRKLNFINSQQGEFLKCLFIYLTSIKLTIINIKWSLLDRVHIVQEL